MHFASCRCQPCISFKLQCGPGSLHTQIKWHVQNPKRLFFPFLVVLARSVAVILQGDARAASSAGTGLCPAGSANWGRGGSAFRFPPWWPGPNRVEFFDRDDRVQNLKPNLKLAVLQLGDRLRPFMFGLLSSCEYSWVLIWIQTDTLPVFAQGHVRMLYDGHAGQEILSPWLPHSGRGAPWFCRKRCGVKTVMASRGIMIVIVENTWKKTSC